MRLRHYGLHIIALGVLLFASCATVKQSSYEGNRGEDYSVEIKLDSNLSEEETYLVSALKENLIGGFKEYSAITIVDSEAVIKSQKETESGIYSDEDRVQIGQVKNSKHRILGHIEKTSKGYAVNIKAVNIESGVLLSNFSGSYTKYEMETPIPAKEASRSLFKGFSIKLSPKAENEINTSIVLEKAKIAEKNNDMAAAIGFYSKAFNKSGDNNTLKKLKNLRKSKKPDWVAIKLNMKNFMKNEFVLFTYEPSPRMRRSEGSSNNISLEYTVSIFPDKAAVDVYNEFKKKIPSTSDQWEDDFFLPSYIIKFGLYNSAGTKLAETLLDYYSPPDELTVDILTQSLLRRFYEEKFKIAFENLSENDLVGADILIDEIILKHSDNEKLPISSSFTMMTEDEYQYLYKDDIKKQRKIDKSGSAPGSNTPLRAFLPALAFDYISADIPIYDYSPDQIVEHNNDDDKENKYSQLNSRFNILGGSLRFTKRHSPFIAGIFSSHIGMPISDSKNIIQNDKWSMRLVLDNSYSLSFLIDKEIVGFSLGPAINSMLFLGKKNWETDDSKSSFLTGTFNVGAGIASALYVHLGAFYLYTVFNAFYNMWAVSFYTLYSGALDVEANFNLHNKLINEKNYVLTPSIGLGLSF